MNIQQIVNILNKAIPIEDSWCTESYGPYNINPKKKIKKILYCVTATREVEKYFYDNNYDLLISHHPYIKNVPQLIYHTALDCCENGLNDMWRDYLNVQKAKHFDKNLGWFGNIESIEFKSLLEKIEKFIGSPVKGYTFTDGSPINNVVICTGLGGLVFNQAEFTEVDCYITGELLLPNHGKFKAVIEIGHTLSEFIGIKLFRTLLPEIQIDPTPFEIDYFGNEVSINSQDF